MKLNENEYIFHEGEDVELPETHEWLEATTYEDAAYGVVRFIRGFAKIFIIPELRMNHDGDNQ